MRDRRPLRGSIWASAVWTGALWAGAILAGAIGVLVPQRDLAAQQAAPLQTFAMETLAIESGGRKHVFKVELADSPAQQSQGLMWRRAMAKDAGMLFDYRRPTQISMWMANTYIPLDMIFIDAGGVIRRIAERTVPLSTETIGSGEPARAVLEVNGGTAAALGIKVGDRVLHARFGRAP
ncbi:MAG: DUF192 domain-containing protein [Alphaproteobacteria bacterium]|nr:DUF192 domain-containing protein [Alphaproteobacteria bacterium]